MLQPSEVRETIAPERQRARTVAVGFYSMLVREGFTSDQIVDLSLRLLDHVTDDGTEPVALAAK